jgi:outer membrane receptor protein involved in Fe transport
VGEALTVWAGGCAPPAHLSGYHESWRNPQVETALSGFNDSAITGFPAGSEIPDTPKVTASAVLDWHHELSDSLSLFASIEEDYVGDRTDVPLIVTATLQNIDQVLMTLPAYSLTNLRLGTMGSRDNGDTWTATLFVNNLTNNAVLLDPQPQLGLQTQAYTRFTITRPLTAGIDVAYHFH